MGAANFFFQKLVKIMECKIGEIISKMHCQVNILCIVIFIPLMYVYIIIICQFCEFFV